MPGSVLVTVGSTKFDELIKALDDERIAEALVAKGYDKLILQASLHNPIYPLTLEQRRQDSRHKIAVCLPSDRNPMPCSPWKHLWQVGAGSYVPCVLLPRGRHSNEMPNGLSVESFDYVPSLAQYMEAAALIISHAGSGSIFEALRLRKPVIAVPNSILMANHQVCLGGVIKSCSALLRAHRARRESVT
jgi:UDP-N-acetylglucosamine transferase subunit ALG13